MTKQIGEHGLFCPDGEDYAAFALTMQCNAEATDAALTDINTSLGGYLARPWAMATLNGAVVIDDAAGSGTIGPLGLVGAWIRFGAASAGPVPTYQNNNLPAYSNSAPTALMPRGVYLIGAQANWTVGALTANSVRQLLVYGVTTQGGVPSPSTDYVDLYRIQDYQGDGGANGALNVVGFLDNTAGNVAYIESFFSHANTASDITIANAQWRVWAEYLGSGLTI